MSAACAPNGDQRGLKMGVGGERLGGEEGASDLDKVASTGPQAARLRCLRERQHDLDLQPKRIALATEHAEREEERARKEWDAKRKKELEVWRAGRDGGIGRGGAGGGGTAKAHDAWDQGRAADTRRRLGEVGFLDGATFFNLQRSFAVAPHSDPPRPPSPGL
jgi:hypothetical protein